jgi:hypothetical protein
MRKKGVAAQVLRRDASLAPLGTSPQDTDDIVRAVRALAAY